MLISFNNYILGILCLFLMIIKLCFIIIKIINLLSKCHSKKISLMFAYKKLNILIMRNSFVYISH